MSNLVPMLRALAAFQHGDVSFAEEAADEIERLREALEALLHAVCGETGFASAVRADSKTAYPWPSLDAAEERARGVLKP